MKRTIFSAVTILILSLLVQSAAWATGSYWNHRHSGPPRVHNLADILKSGEIVGEVNFCGPQGTNGAHVDLVGESFQAVLGANGDFKLRYVPRGSYTLRVSIPGQPDHTQAVTVKKRKVTDVGGISICPDNDSDGFPLNEDCNDNNGDIFPGAQELCDGVDNDCDGEVDGLGCDCTDADNDGFFAQDGCGTAVDCNDDSETINPNATEICDGIDNNCDNIVDEGFDLETDPNNCGACSSVCTGICQGGDCQSVCGNGAVEPDEQCDDGNQDNSDACPDGVDGTCQDAFCGDGHVHIAGGEECDDGNTTDGDGCQADCTLPVATCPGDVPVGGTIPCDGPDADACENGMRTCQSDGTFGACEETGPDFAEVCNGIDDDCDGQTDEGFSLGGTCAVGQGACFRQGTIVCSADGTSSECSVTPGDPQAETCNGIDDDCDGQTDEIPDVTIECSPFACGGPNGCYTSCGTAGSPSDLFCAPGFHCQDTGQDILFCVPDAVACSDGTPNGGTRQCGSSDIGACEFGTQTCTNGVFGLCVGETGPTPEICNGIDDNCDGTTDEGACSGTGAFNIQPTATYSCGAIGNPVEFQLDVQTFNFQDLGSSTIQVAGAPSGPVMTGSIDSTGSFQVTALIPGGVNEDFRLTGQFTDPDNWTGTFSVNFFGDQLPLSNCVNKSWSIIGTR